VGRDTEIPPGKKLILARKASGKKCLIAVFAKRMGKKKVTGTGDFHQLGKDLKTKQISGRKKGYRVLGLEGSCFIIGILSRLPTRRCYQGLVGRNGLEFHRNKCKRSTGSVLINA